MDAQLDASAIDADAASVDAPLDPLAGLPECTTPVLDALTATAIDLPARDSGGYVVPTSGALDSMRSSVSMLIGGDLSGAGTSADAAGYVLCRGTGTASMLALWRPLTAGLGQPVIVLRMGSARSLVIEAPHPIAETNTLEEAVSLFVALEARALLVAGTHRCANSVFSPCTGSTSFCLAAGTESFRESDMGHVVASHFEVAHEEIADRFPTTLVVSVHGQSDDGVSLSNGTMDPISYDSPVARLARALAVELTGQRISTCNDWPGAPDRDATRLCGTFVVQGRYVNGALPACTTTSESATDRFISLEQSLAVRDSVPAVIRAFEAAFP